ncbi:bacteriocin-like protein [Chryseobacterium sp. JK1]|uniref:bacteriocin-like protein n=1 Tax=Chryseobacterium sp. JK1 TaxID=874294 RepID=UPI003D69D95B
MKKLKKLSRNDLKEVKGGQVWYAETKCGITATTTQDWTPQQANEWRERVEAINCRTPTHVGASDSLA